MTETMTREKTAAAFEHLSQSVYQPIFFSKLAAHKLLPNTEEEKVELLKLGELLLQEHFSKEAEAASSTTKSLRAIVSQVQNRLEKRGAAVPTPEVLPPAVVNQLNKLAASAETQAAIDTYLAALSGQLEQ